MKNKNAKDILMDYGWLILIILIVAGASIYYAWYLPTQQKQNAYDYMTNLGNSLTLFCNRTDNMTFACDVKLCFTTGSSENFCQDTNQTAIFKLVNPYK
jgi:hypothetical protein